MLTPRLTVIGGTLAVAALVTTGVLANHQMLSAAEEQRRGAATLFGQTLSSGFAAELVTVQNTLASLEGNAPLSPQSVVTPPGWNGGVAVFDQYGKWLGPEVSATPPVNAALQRRLFDDIRSGGLGVSDLVPDQSGRLLIGFAVKSRQHPDAVIVRYVTRDELGAGSGGVDAKFAGMAAAADGGAYSLVDRNGTVMASSDERLVGKPLPGVDALQLPLGEPLVAETGTGAGQRVLVATPISPDGLSMVYTQPRSAFYGDIGVKARIVTGSFALLLVLIGVMTALAMQRRHRILRRSSERLEHAATHDPLTGLANRAKLLSEVEQALSRAADNGTSVTVLYLDLDSFKPVNDTYGHAAGDAVLCSVADRLRISVRGGDLVARLGGDEFAVLLQNPLEGHALEALVNRMETALSQPVTLADGQVRIGASIGSATTGPRTNASQLLNRADAAMYAAKAEKARSSGSAGFSVDGLPEPRLEAAARSEPVRQSPVRS